MPPTQMELATARKLGLALPEQTGLAIHLGCGNKKVAGMINCDIRQSAATDLVMDCSRLDPFDSGSADAIFVNAFFEHLHVREQIPFLRECQRVLADPGTLTMLGIPDFETVARAYVAKEAGILGPVFDLYHVYRYSHGGDFANAPEFWMEELHKSLFDTPYLEYLLEKAAFGSWLILRYCYPGENLPLNLAVFGWKRGPQAPSPSIPLSTYISMAQDLEVVASKGCEPGELEWLLALSEGGAGPQGQ